jgi:hypothetical protein
MLLFPISAERDYATLVTDELVSCKWLVMTDSDFGAARRPISPLNSSSEDRLTTRESHISRMELHKGS